MAALKQNCRKILCIGRNYADHIKELNNTRPAAPFFFLKPTSSILPPPHHNTPIIIPKNVNVHYEVELGLVVSQTTKNLNFSNLDSATADKECLKYIKSYFVGIDLTARTIQEAAKKAGLPWTMAKGFDTFLPISQEISKSKIPDPHNARLWLKVNGETKQDDGTDLMLFRIPRILQDCSRVMTLEEGDLIITGTPKGVGQIRNGDVVECGISVDGKEVEEGSIKIGVEDAEEGGYVWDAKL